MVDSSPLIIRAQLRNPDGQPLAGVPVRVVAFNLADGTPVVLSASQEPDAAGLFETTIDVVDGPLPSIRLLNADTQGSLAEQWSSYEPVARLLDFGFVRVDDEPLLALEERQVFGVLEPLAVALDGSVEIGAALAERDAALAERDAAIVARDAALAERDAAQAQNVALQAALEGAQAQSTTLQGALTTAQAQNAAVQAALATAQAELSSTQDQLDQALAQVELLGEQLESLQADTGTSSLAGVVENVGKQLAATHKALTTSRSPFQLGKLSLSLKVVPSSATEFGFASLEELAGLGSDTLSTVDLDFAQTTPAAPTAPSTTVPTLQGLTEPAARRRLAALGLAATVVHQAVSDTGEITAAGRVLKQVPLAGTMLAPGQPVTLVLGKPLGAAS